MRIYLSATMDIYSARVALQVPRLLVSYEGPNLAKKFGRGMAACGHPTDWCIDSGAHFFISDHYKKSITPPVEKVNEHQVAFMKFLSELPSTARPTFVVELDLQDLYGQAVVDAWRVGWLAYQKVTNQTVCLVWHPGDGRARWQALLDSPLVRMVGLSAGHGTNTAHVRKFVLEAYEARKPVHGFASFKLLREVPFFSVDSTSWGSGAIFGRVARFDAKTGRMVGVSVGRKAQAVSRSKAAGALAHLTNGAVHTSSGLGVGVSGPRGLQQLYSQALAEYLKMEKWYTAYWRGKGVDWESWAGTVL